MNPLTVLGKNLLQESDCWILWTPVGIAIGIAVYFANPFEPPFYCLAATPLIAIYRDGAGVRIEQNRPRRAMHPWSVGWNAKLRHEASQLGDSRED